MYLEGIKPLKASSQLTLSLVMMTTMHTITAKVLPRGISKAEKKAKRLHTIKAMRNSKSLTGLELSGSRNPSMRSTSNTVMRSPPQIGSFGKSKHRAMAEPRSSARSVAIIAISEITYRGYNMHHLYNRGCLGRLWNSRRQ